jgi:hypothetical protein
VRRTAVEERERAVVPVEQPLVLAVHVARAARAPELRVRVDDGHSALEGRVQPEREPDRELRAREHGHPISRDGPTITATTSARMTSIGAQLTSLWRIVVV